MLGQYLGSGSGTTKLLLHLNGNSTDSSGNGNNGTDTAITYSLANGKFGQGASFNGSSSNIELPSGVVLTSTANQTIALWFKLGNITQVDKDLINLSEDTTKVTYDHDYNNGVYKFRRIKQMVAIQEVTTAFTDTTSFHSAVGTYDGTKIHLYIDGVEIGTGTVASGNGSSGAHNSANVGCDNNSSQFFNGSIDEVIVENTAWSAEKVKKYYTMTKGRFGII